MAQDKIKEAKWRRAVQEKDNFTCRRCGRKRGYIHAHHLATRGSRPDLKYDVTNGICLCSACHTWVHANPRAAAEAGLLVSLKYPPKNQAIEKLGL